MDKTCFYESITYKHAVSFVKNRFDMKQAGFIEISQVFLDTSTFASLLNLGV